MQVKKLVFKTIISLCLMITLLFTPFQAAYADFFEDLGQGLCLALTRGGCGSTNMPGPLPELDVLVEIGKLTLYNYSLMNPYGITVPITYLTCVEETDGSEYCFTADGSSDHEEILSTQSKAIRSQSRVAMDVPMRLASFPNTHNSFNANDYSDGISYIDPNHKITIVNQLNLGIRGIEMDLHNYNNDVTLCHDGGKTGEAHLGCFYGDRNFGEGLADLMLYFEILDHKENEVILLYLENHLYDEDKSDSSDYSYSQAIDYLETYIGDLIYKPEYKCQTFNSPENTDDVVHLSKNDILAAGKNIILIGAESGGNSDSCNTDWGNYVFNGGWKGVDEDILTDYVNGCADDSDNYENKFKDYMMRGYNDATFIGGDGNMSASKVRTMAYCGINAPSPEALDWGSDYTTNQIWSWSTNQPDNYNGTQDCALQWSNVRWDDENCSNTHVFACQHPDNRDWKVTSAAGAWDQGWSVCESEFGSQGYEFSVPANGYENNQLADAKGAAGQTNVWLKFSDANEEGIWTSNFTPVTWVNHDEYTDPTYASGTRGRYVMVSLPDTNEYLHLAEVQVFDSNGNNLAQGKPATQSSTHVSTSGVTQYASAAVDGSTDGSSGSLVSHTNKEGTGEQWWQVDLGDVYEISGITIYNRTDCCTFRLNGAVVTISRYPQDGLAAHYKLNESSSDTFVTDSTGIGYNATSNISNWGDGILEGAAYFSASGENLEVPYEVSIKDVDTTVCAWGKLDSFGSAIRILLQHRDVTGTGRTILAVKNEKMFSYLGASDTYGNTAISVGEWNQYCATLSSSGVFKFYLNGNLEQLNGGTDTSVTLNVESNAAGFYIGKGKDSGSNSYGWDGAIDDVRFYDRVLDDSEIEVLYDSQNEWAHLTYNDSSNLGDNSANEYDATITGVTYSNGAAVFDNDADEIVLPNQLSFERQGQDFAFCTWANSTSNSNQNLLSQRGGTGSGLSLLYITASGKLSTNLGTGAISTATSVNSWNHYCLTITESGTAKLYLNGNLEMTSSITVSSGNGQFVIGAHASSDGYTWSGSLDETILFKRILSASEIQQLASTSP
jgi:Concanavalin A-like lectin/glucanases superfamily/NedA-like, galactose-binding domain